MNPPKSKLIARRTSNQKNDKEAESAPQSTTDVTALFAQAVAQHQAGKWGAAVVLYEQILARDGKHIHALSNLGTLHLQQGHLEEGVQLIGRLLEINPHQPYALNNLGIALQALKRLDEALASFDSAIWIKPDYVEAYFNRGNALQDLKRPDEALASYDRALARKPDYAKAHINRGLALQDLKRPDEALASYDRALALKPNYAEACNNRGLALQDLKRPDEALASYDRALALKPEYAAAYYNRGNALQELERLDEALASYDRALALKPDLAEAWSYRGIVLKDLRRLDDAMASYDRALALKPDYAEAYYNRGNALQELERPDEALASYDRALALKPDLAEAWSNRGIALKDLWRLDEALASYDRALALKPDLAEAWSNRGVALKYLGRLDEALASYDRALALKPDLAKAHNNRGLVLQDLKRLDEALASYDRAIALRADYAEAYFNKSLLLLLVGEFAQGWSLYEWRWKANLSVMPPYVTQRQWAGETVEGTLLVWGEQGLGDQIMFALLVPELVPYASQLAVAVDPRLVGLLQRSFPQIEVLPLDSSLPVERFAAQIALAGLGKFLRTQPSDFLRESPVLLKADEARSEILRKKLRQGGKRVCGLSWRSKNKQYGQSRSIDLPSLVPLLSKPGFVWVDLQYDDTLQERTSLRADSGLELVKLDEVDNWHDIDGLAALTNACDLIVTIDNTTAHLAAALGKPTWIMLPYSPDCRWLMDREDSPWYSTARLFRQSRLDDWRDVVQRMNEALGHLVK